jgi:hypothetical protein
VGGGVVERESFGLVGVSEAQGAFALVELRRLAHAMKRARHKPPISARAKLTANWSRTCAPERSRCIVVTAVTYAASACYSGISGAVFKSEVLWRCCSCAHETRLHFVLAA